MWDAAVDGRTLSLDERASLRMACLIVAEQCVSAIDLLYHLAGSTAIFQSSPLERCFRDVHTAAQHLQVQHGRWEAVGQVLLGLDPGAAVL